MTYFVEVSEIALASPVQIYTSKVLSTSEFHSVEGCLCPAMRPLTRDAMKDRGSVWPIGRTCRLRLFCIAEIEVCCRFPTEVPKVIANCLN